MKLFVFSLVCLSATCSAFAQQTGAPATSAPVAVGAEHPARASSAPWSVIGVWNCEHPAWAKPVVLSADGTFFLTRIRDHDAGTWKLEADKDHLHLVLQWYQWNPETLAMVGPDEFRGQVRGGEMTMRRDWSVSPVIAPKVETAPATSPPLAPAPLNSSPAGHWVWQHSSAVNAINSDGTVGADRNKGTWRWTDQAHRQLQIDWKSGYVDKSTISEDGKTMRVTNNNDEEFTVRRLTPPASGPAVTD